MIVVCGVAVMALMSSPPVFATVRVRRCSRASRCRPVCRSAGWLGKGIIGTVRGRMAGMGRRIVVVSGAPGAGKTTLAYPLAAALGLPLFAKDTIKECLYDSLGDDGPADLPTSRRLGGAAMDLLWRLARDAPACVLEANFRYMDEYARPILRELGAGGVVVEVYCVCPPQEAERRYDARGLTPARHRVHTWTTLPPEVRAGYVEPIGVGTVISVDTTKAVDVGRLAGRILAALDSDRAAGS